MTDTATPPITDIPVKFRFVVQEQPSVGMTATDREIRGYEAAYNQARRVNTRESVSRSGDRYFWPIVILLLVLLATFLYWGLWLGGFDQIGLDLSALQYKGGCDTTQERFVGTSKDGVPVYVVYPLC